MQHISEVLSDTASNYSGSEKTYNIVLDQIKERWGGKESKNYDPYQNCLTLRSWARLGFRVKKGEHALRSITFTETKDAEGNILYRRPRKVFLFYYKQVEKITE